MSEPVVHDQDPPRPPEPWESERWQSDLFRFLALLAGYMKEGGFVTNLLKLIRTGFIGIALLVLLIGWRFHGVTHLGGWPTWVRTLVTVVAGGVGTAGGQAIARRRRSKRRPQGGDSSDTSDTDAS